MSNIIKRLGVVVFLFILAILIATPCFGTGTKTAYTRDGVNFISKHRVDENIGAGIARPGDYKEMQVPLNTFVLGGFLEDTLKQKESAPSQPNASKQTMSAYSNPADTSKQNKSETAQLSKATQTASTLISNNGNDSILLILYVILFGLFLIGIGKQNICSLGNKKSSESDTNTNSDTSEPTKIKD